MKYTHSSFIRPVITALCLALAGAVNTGCVAVAAGAGAGAVAYIRGDLEVTYQAEIAHVHEAAEAALRDLEFSVINSQRDQVSGALTARTAQDRRIQIDLDDTGTGTTEASIRVGTFGDQDLSMRIHEQIQERL